MQAAQLAPSSGRLTSIALVIGLHVLIVAGLSAGLMKVSAQAPQPPAQVEVIDDSLPPPEPPPPLPQLRDATPQAPLIPIVPVPEHPSEQAPNITLRPAEQAPAIVFEPQPAPRQEGRVEPALAASTPQPAGLLCPTQARPQLPALAQEGSAHLRVLATVQGGRVVAVQLTTLRALPERRAQRALLAEVEQVLRSGYACTQDGVFEQEFLFRVD